MLLKKLAPRDHTSPLEVNNKIVEVSEGNYYGEEEGLQKEEQIMYNVVRNQQDRKYGQRIELQFC